MNEYKNIRRLYLVEGLSQRQIAKQLHISRNTVKKYCDGNEVPWKRKDYERVPSIVTDRVCQFIQGCLDEDEKEAVKKQRHTAKRIYDRLVEEQGFTGSETTIRRTVRRMISKHKEAFVPLEFSPGEAIQVDWGTGTIYKDGVRRPIQLFCGRLCSSCAPIVFAYERQNEESFLDAFVQMFEHFGGVPRRAIFDNGKVAVKEGFGAHARKQAGYAALEAHYGFEAVFCNVASGNEKGLVEGLVGWARRNILVPIPKVKTLAELNGMLKKRCEQYMNHSIRGKRGSVGELYKVEKEELLPLPGYRFETAKSRNVRVDSYATVRFDTNNYSVPVEYCGCEISVKGNSGHVSAYCKGKEIAIHERCYGKKQSIFALEHYLPLLERKGRAILNARPVRDALPEAFIEWLRESSFDHRQLMHILYRCVDEGWEGVWKDPSGLPKREVATIEDIVTVQSVDLRNYDLLYSKREGVRDGH